MEHNRIVIVHGLNEATAALAEARAEGRGVTLLSAPGATLYAGCGWWRALVDAARAEYPDVPCSDILDCADATGMALAALRIGVTRLVLWQDAPGRSAAVAIAESLGGFVLPAPPAADDPSREFSVRNRTGGSAANETSGNGDKTRSPG